MARRRRGHREAVLRVAASDPGLTRAEIARRVGCSESTVNRHMGPATSAPATRADDTRSQALPSLAQHQDAPTRAKQPEKTDPPPRMGAAADRSSRLREAAAPDIAAASLLVLADDSDADVRAAAAANTNCPEACFDRFAADCDHTVRVAAAANPHIPVDRLVRLFGDSHPGVRAAMAARDDIAMGTLERMASVDASEVRSAAAANTRCNAGVAGEADGRHQQLCEMRCGRQPTMHAGSSQSSRDAPRSGPARNGRRAPEPSERRCGHPCFGPGAGSESSSAQQSALRQRDAAMPCGGSVTPRPSPNRFEPCVPAAVPRNVRRRPRSRGSLRGCRQSDDAS